MRTVELTLAGGGLLLLLLAATLYWSATPSPAKELFLKTTAAIGLVVGGSIGLWKYFDTAEMQFRRPFWDKRIQVYYDASEAAATIASADLPEARARATEKFHALYFGPMVMFEDPAVELAMIRFEHARQEREAGKLTKGDLENQSLRLASTLRESIGHDWNVKLAELHAKYKETASREPSETSTIKNSK
jgi:hypothetical protein